MKNLLNIDLKNISIKITDLPEITSNLNEIKACVVCPNPRSRRVRKIMLGGSLTHHYNTCIVNTSILIDIDFVPVCPTENTLKSLKERPFMEEKDIKMLGHGDIQV
uniref:Uncharacterized protein n=1 Tax=Romanomermis culicivorax TaxID=13658 RepID=A0A915JLI2_ROMCU